jgi:dTDP-4-dehydrorhamnose reductase
MSTKILITGANGQLGKTFKELFDRKDQSISLTFLTKAELDITNQKALNRYFESNKFDYCVNCAAYTNVEQAEDSIAETFQVNMEAVGYLSEYCNKSNTVLIHISTDYVFDGKKNTPYLETDRTNPINQYGKSKLAGEKLIMETLKEYFIIRTSWLYSKYPKNFLTTIVSKIKENAELTITKSQKGTPTSCIELAKFIFWLIKNGNKDFGIYHFSAKGEATWYDFALRIADHFKDYNKNKILATTVFKSKAERPNYSVMDNSKAQKLYKSKNHWKVDVDSVVANILGNNQQ